MATIRRRPYHAMGLPPEERLPGHKTTLPLNFVGKDPHEVAMTA